MFKMASPFGVASYLLWARYSSRALKFSCPNCSHSWLNHEQTFHQQTGRPNNVNDHLLEILCGHIASIRAKWKIEMEKSRLNPFLGSKPAFVFWNQGRKGTCEIFCRHISSRTLTHPEKSQGRCRDKSLYRCVQTVVRSSSLLEEN